MKIRVNFRADTKNRELINQTISDVEKKLEFKKLFVNSPSYGWAFLTPGKGQNDCFLGDPPFVFRALEILSRTQDGLLFLENIEVTNKYKPEPEF